MFLAQKYLWCKMTTEATEAALEHSELERQRLQQELDEANAAQWKVEAKLRKGGLVKTYAETLCRQSYGPMRRILIPRGHSRKSRYPLFQAHLECDSAAIEVDYDAIMASVGSASAPEDALDEVPLDILAEVW